MNLKKNSKQLKGIFKTKQFHPHNGLHLNKNNSSSSEMSLNCVRNLSSNTSTKLSCHQTPVPPAIRATGGPASLAQQEQFKLKLKMFQTH